MLSKYLLVLMKQEELNQPLRFALKGLGWLVAITSLFLFVIKENMVIIIAC